MSSYFSYQYERAPLQECLIATLGNQIIGDSRRRLCIPSFDGRFGEVHIFKTPHHEDYKKDWKEKLTTVALATSAAPTFFKLFQDGHRSFADGGIWANNPVMIGLVDALTCYDLNRRDIHILSLGCGETGFEVEQRQVSGGLWQWRKIIAAAMHLSSQNALGQAGLLVGRDQLLRIDAVQSIKNPIDLDDYARASAELPSAAHELSADWGERVRPKFFFAPADPYEAIYGPRSSPAGSN